VKVYVRAFGPLQTALGADRIRLELQDNSCVKDAIEFLVDGWILPNRPDFWDVHKKQFSLPVVIMVSNQDVQDETQQLNDGQEILLVAPMAGG
jgi:molybdopterin converting factor small subunit